MHRTGSLLRIYGSIDVIVRTNSLPVLFWNETPVTSEGTTSIERLYQDYVYKLRCEITPLIDIDTQDPKTVVQL